MKVDLNGGRVAITEVCDEVSCQQSQLLVRGDRISFVSVEQVKKVGRYPLDEEKMPSDVFLPEDFVVVHDTAGILFDRCHMHIVKWRKGRKRTMNGSDPDVSKYFGKNAEIQVGDVEIPQGPWKKRGKIAFIRYRRTGNLKGNYEHDFDPCVFLYSTQRPLSWKLRLPNGCIVDERGFVRP